MRKTAVVLVVCSLFFWATDLDQISYLFLLAAVVFSNVKVSMK